jgi:hypothetical protein
MKAESFLTYGAAAILVFSGVLIQFGANGSDDSQRRGRAGLTAAVRGNSGFSVTDEERLLGSESAREVTVVRPQFPRPMFIGTPVPDPPPPNLIPAGQPRVMEVTVPGKVELLSRGAPVTSSDPAPLGELSLVTDGDKNGEDGYFVDLLPLCQWIQIDLGEPREIWLLWLWMFHKASVSYKDIIICISDDPAFESSRTVFNNDHDNTSGMGAGKDAAWMETSLGHPVRLSGLRGRYVRLYSNGRNIDDTNQWTEVEVYGR